MSAFIITRDELNRLVEELKKTHEVYGPKVDPQTQQVFFERVEGQEGAAGGEIDLDAELPSMPPKEILFPQVDRILKCKYDAKEGSVEITRLWQEKPKALVGLRPCDLAGIQVLDRFFLGQEYVDEVYRNHRRKSFIVSNACTKPFKQCFCVCFHTGPSAEEGYDLNLIRIGEVYHAETGSEKGEELAARLGFRSATAEQAREKDEAIRNSIALFPELAKENKAWVSRVMNRVTTGFIKPEIWDRIGKQCFECGACSFVCPTCSCFNIEDTCTKRGECERLRTRDSCSLEGYTRMAGDHNPRKPVEDRRNKRFFCKLSYSQSKKYLRPGCVGCGRCVWVCPGDIGLPNVVQDIRRETIEQVKS